MLIIYLKFCSFISPECPYRYIGANKLPQEDKHFAALSAPSESDCLLRCSDSINCVVVSYNDGMCIMSSSEWRAAEASKTDKAWKQYKKGVCAKPDLATTLTLLSMLQIVFFVFGVQLFLHEAL